MAKGLSFAALFEQAGRAIAKGVDPSRLFADIGARLDTMKREVATVEQNATSGIADLRQWVSEQLEEQPAGKGYAWRAASAGTGKDTYIETGKNALYFVVNGNLVGSITADGDLLLAGSFRTVDTLIANPRFVEGLDTSQRNVRWNKAGVIELVVETRPATDPRVFEVVAFIDGEGNMTTNCDALTGQTLTGVYPKGIWDAGTGSTTGPLYMVVAGDPVAAFDSGELQLAGGIFDELNTGQIRAGSV